MYVSLLQLPLLYRQYVAGKGGTVTFYCCGLAPVYNCAAGGGDGDDHQKEKKKQ